LVVQSSEYRQLRDKDISRETGVVWIGKLRIFAVQDVRPSFKVPSDNWGLPDDFAGITIFLASAASDFVTGTAIPIDGGYSIAG